MKLKYGEKAKLCYMNTDSFRVYIKTADIFVIEISEVVDTRFVTLSCELEGQLPRVKYKKVIGLLMKGELGGKGMTEVIISRLEKYRYLTDVNDENKKSKSTKMYFIKQKLKFEDYENCQEANKLEKDRNYMEKYSL